MRTPLTNGDTVPDRCASGIPSLLCPPELPIRLLNHFGWLSKQVCLLTVVFPGLIVILNARFLAKSLRNK